MAPHHRPRRPHEGAVRDLRQRHALQAEAGARSTAWRPSRATRSTPRAGTTTTPGRISREPGRQGRRHHRHRRHRGAGHSRPRRRRPRSCTCSSARRRPSTSANDWETDPEWAAKLPPGWQAKRREKAMTGPPLTDEQTTKLAAMSREEKIRRQENANIDHMMRIHRRIDEIVEGQGDGRGAEAVVHVHVQAAVLPQRVPADVQPPERPSGRHARQGHHRDHRARARSSRASEYELDVLIYATGFEVQKTGIYNQIVGEDGLDLNDKYDDGIRTLLGIHIARLPEPLHHGRLPGLVPVQPDRHAADPGRPHRGVHRLRAPPRATRRSTRPARPRSGGCRRSSRTAARPPATHECTPGYYNFEGESNRRQDGNYNGGFPKYYPTWRQSASRWTSTSPSPERPPPFSVAPVRPNCGESRRNCALWHPSDDSGPREGFRQGPLSCGISGASPTVLVLTLMQVGVPDCSAASRRTLEVLESVDSSPTAAEGDHDLVVVGV